MRKNKTDVSYGIIGLGRFGQALAVTLADAGKEVVAVDNNESKVKEIRQYTEHAYVAEELTKEVLEEIGIQNCDTVIVCIGEKIDTSILTTLNVVNLGVPNVIAKAISRDQGMVLEKIGAEVVYPERDMALRLGKRLLTGCLLDYLPLENGVEITEIKATEKIVGKSVVEVELRKRYGLNIIAIEHENRTETEIGPDYRFQKNDISVVIGKDENVEKFEAYL